MIRTIGLMCIGAALGMCACVVIVTLIVDWKDRRRK